MENLNILEIQARMVTGSLTSRSLCEYYLERIERYDRSGSKLNAVIELNPDALDIADRLDRQRVESGPRSPVHGIPILLKDNIDTADRMMTTAGSLALEGHHALRDAFLAARLRESGAVLLGKTNLSEWANFRSSRSVSGWSSRGGQTRSPYDPRRNPCGSSSGSAVAVAADLCTAAIGTETDGSIICPASVNGVVGFKPSLGLVSRSGIIPIAHSQDTAGPIARSVLDAALLLNAITGHDPQEPGSDPQTVLDYTHHLSTDALQGRRIGVLRHYLGAHPMGDRIFDAALATLADLGAELVDPVEIETREQIHEPEFEVLLYEFKHDLNRYLAGLPEDFRVSTLEDLIRFNAAHAPRVMPYFGQEIFLKAQEKAPLSDPAYLEALRESKRLAGRDGIDAALQKHSLDALVAPSNAPAWLIDLVRGDMRGGGSSTPAAVAGYPNATVPSGFVHGLPVGISFFGGYMEDANILAFAHAFEVATHHRRPPDLDRDDSDDLDY